MKRVQNVVVDRLLKITVALLYDKFDFRQKRIYEFVVTYQEEDRLMREAAINEDDESMFRIPKMLEWAKTKGFDVQKIVEEIPTSVKLGLAKGAKMTKYSRGEVNTLLLMHLCTVIPVFSVKYKVSKPKIEMYIKHLISYMEEYQSNRLTDKIIEMQIFEDPKIKELFIK